MTDRAQARAARLAALLNEDGTVTPADGLPDGLLTEAREDLEATYLEALTADTIGEGLTKGRLSQLENPDLDPQLSTITQQADALDYD